jgi:hypothetical protein
MDYHKIQYKINKYLTKYNSSTNLESKLFYSKKYLYYVKYDKQIGGNEIGTGTETETTRNQLIDSISKQIDSINKNITEIKPVFQFVNRFDNTIKEKITSNYPGYNKDEDLVKYYLDIVSQCKEIL